MSDPITGHCRCGACSYTLAIESLPRAYACHCHQCQRWSGSAFAVNMIVPEPAIATSGPIAQIELTTGDRTSVQRVCATCHARLYNTNTRRPGLAVVRAGTLDRSEELACVLHIYTATKQGWVTLPDGVPAYPEACSPEEFRAALSG